MGWCSGQRPGPGTTDPAQSKERKETSSILTPPGRDMSSSSGSRTSRRNFFYSAAEVQGPCRGLYSEEGHQRWKPWILCMWDRDRALVTEAGWPSRVQSVQSLPLIKDNTELSCLVIFRGFFEVFYGLTGVGASQATKGKGWITSRKALKETGWNLPHHPCSISHFLRLFAALILGQSFTCPGWTNVACPPTTSSSVVF